MMMKQAQKYEAMLNQSLIDRLIEEDRFAAIQQLQDIFQAKGYQIFHDTFDRERI